MRPIYQMSVGVVEGHDVGLVFSSEARAATVDSLLFVLPVPAEAQSLTSFHRYLQAERFYFPAVLRGDLVNLESEVEFPFLRFRVPDADEFILFQVVTVGFHRLPFSSGPDLSGFLTYTGTDRDLARSDVRYVPIIPDVEAMDEAYRDHGLALVGLTPRFGTRPSLAEDHR